MTTEEASKILKMLLGFLKGEIEPPSPKTVEEAEKFEQDGYECLNMAIRSLEAWQRLLKLADDLQENMGRYSVLTQDIKFIFKEVENDS